MIVNMMDLIIQRKESNAGVILRDTLRCNEEAVHQLVINEKNDSAQTVFLMKNHAKREKRVMSTYIYMVFEPKDAFLKSSIK